MIIPYFAEYVIIYFEEITMMWVSLSIFGIGFVVVYITILNFTIINTYFLCLRLKFPNLFSNK